jgi:CBS domain-containing membrane protein
MGFNVRGFGAGFSRDPFGQLGWLRGAVGAGIGVGLAGIVGLALHGTGASALPWLVAPVGASAVLVFTVPASPLAQPWSVIGGSVISAIVGLAIGHVVGMPTLAAALSLGLSIAVMSMARCLHPPGGACALLYALGASGPDVWGVTYLPVIVINVAVLAGVGWVYNNLTGHSWPHRPMPIPAAVAPMPHAATVHQALTEVLAEWNDVIDADVDDLDAIFIAVERRVRSREQNAPPSAG